MVKGPILCRFCLKLYLYTGFYNYLFNNAIAFNSHTEVICFLYKDGLYILLPNNGDLDWIVIT